MILKTNLVSTFLYAEQSRLSSAAICRIPIQARRGEMESSQEKNHPMAISSTGRTRMAGAGLSARKRQSCAALVTARSKPSGWITERPAAARPIERRGSTKACWGETMKTAVTVTSLVAFVGGIAEKFEQSDRVGDGSRAWRNSPPRGSNRSTTTATDSSRWRKRRSSLIKEVAFLEELLG